MSVGAASPKLRVARSIDGRVITRILLVRDRGRVEFRYDFNGELFESWMPVHQSREVLALRESQEIDLRVDATQPRRAIIRDLLLG